MDKLKRTFSANLRRQLAENDRTQADLCRHLGISSATASDWCNARKLPRIEKMQSICEWLGCEVSDLLRDREDMDVRTDGQQGMYDNNELIKDIADRLREDPGIAVMLGGLLNLSAEDTEIVKKIINRML